MGVNGSDDFDAQPTVSKAYVIIHLSDITILIIFVYWIEIRKLISNCRTVLKKIGIDAFNVVFVFFVSLSLFPGMTYSIKSLNYLPDRQDLYSVILVVSTLE
jgi:hypothetical protein